MLHFSHRAGNVSLRSQRGTTRYEISDSSQLLMPRIFLKHPFKIITFHTIRHFLHLVKIIFLHKSAPLIMQVDTRPTIPYDARHVCYIALQAKLFSFSHQSISRFSLTYPNLNLNFSILLHLIQENLRPSSTTMYSASEQAFISNELQTEILRLQRIDNILHKLHTAPKEEDDTAITCEEGRSVACAVALRIRALQSRRRQCMAVLRYWQLEHHLQILDHIHSEHDIKDTSTHTRKVQFASMAPVRFFDCTSEIPLLEGEMYEATHL